MSRPPPPMRIVVKGWFSARELTHAEAEAHCLREAVRLVGKPEQARCLEEAARHRACLSPALPMRPQDPEQPFPPRRGFSLPSMDERHELRLVAAGAAQAATKQAHYWRRCLAARGLLRTERDGTDDFPRCYLTDAGRDLLGAASCDGGRAAQCDGQGATQRDDQGVAR